MFKSIKNFFPYSAYRQHSLTTRRVSNCFFLFRAKYIESMWEKKKRFLEGSLAVPSRITDLSVSPKYRTYSSPFYHSYSHSPWKDDCSRDLNPFLRVGVPRRPISRVDEPRERTRRHRISAEIAQRQIGWTIYSPRCCRVRRRCGETVSTSSVLAVEPGGLKASPMSN